ncbi:MAG: hypothetical protein AAFO95_13010, partial [Cyanobacteria bacterium J06600_6]
MRNTLLPIIPALLGFSISTICLIIYAVNKNRKGILLLTIISISSSFIFQMAFDLTIEKADLIKNFADKYQNVFHIPIFTIIATTIGIFLG